jgi:hypothetical protein
VCVHSLEGWRRGSCLITQCRQLLWLTSLRQNKDGGSAEVVLQVGYCLPSHVAETRANQAARLGFSPVTPTSASTSP